MRAAARRQQVGVALFPFLAVLICTMGALIVLLVLLVQQSRVDAKTISQSRAATSAADATAKEQLEDLQWRSQLLQQSRTEKTQELAESRDKLAHLEEHIQRLEKEASQLLQRAKSIDEGQQLREGDLAAARAELTRLQAEIERKKAELESAKKQNKDGEQWFALIPYEGPHGTRRRPIYLECTELGVTIQPEGILLGEADFNGPRGPGNPLDAAVRTIRDHMQRTGGAKAGEAYPLLVVRPGGIRAYGAARGALQSWDDEFGYELVGDDKHLDFGPPDAALSSTLKGSIVAARQRQAALSAMMPRRFQSQEPPAASSPERSTMVGAAASPVGGRGVGIGGGGSGTGMAGGTGSGLGDPLAQGQFGGAAAGSGTAAGETGGYQTTGQGGMGTVAGGGPNGGQYSGQTGGASGVQAAGTSAAGTSGATGGTGGAAGGATGGAGASGSSTAGQVGAPSPNLQFGSPKSGSGQSGSNQSSSGQSGGTARSGGASGNGAAARGNNWGLPGSRGRTTAVTRTVHIAVLRDRLVMVPDRGDNRPPQHLPVSPELQPADVDRFVTAVQSEIKSWGLAVADGYWKPVLQFDVAPDAERQFANLQTALSGSGFAIERKSP